MQAVLRPGLLQGVGATLSGACAPEIRERLEALGAHDGTDVLVHGATAPRSADDVRAALDDAWDAIRAHKLPPSPGLIVLLSPPPENAHAHAARAGLENLARTTSVEWARKGTRIVTLLGGGEEQVAEMVAYVASPAGDYFSGTALTLTS